MRRVALRGIALSLGLGLGSGCGDSPRGEEVTTTLSPGDPTTTNTNTGAESGGTEAGTGASRLDVEGTGGVGGDGVAFTCDNLDAFGPGSVGCDFVGVQVPLPSYGDPAEAAWAYGIAVGNPAQEVAHVVIEDFRSGAARTLAEFDLQPRESRVTALTGSEGVLGQQAMIGLGLNPKSAFHVRSDVPITATQISPMGGGPSHIAEASALLPTTSLDTIYIAAGYTGVAPEVDGFGIVVAFEDNTTIRTSSGNASLDAYDSHYFAHGNDATGFSVVSDKPVALFSGSSCATVPNGVLACDHIEEQMLPLSSWGRTYVAARHPQRVPDVNPTPEEVRWRIIAGEDNTQVTLTPGVDGYVVITLPKAGDFHEIATPESFVAESEQAFMLTQYMTGCVNVGGPPAPPHNNECRTGMYEATGDPYMVQVPSVEQWGHSAPFLTDTSYARDFVVVMHELGTTVSLDCFGELPSAFVEPIEGTNYGHTWVELDRIGMGGDGDCVDGQQFLEADGPVGIYVGGMDYATSYGYPGAMNIARLWEPPPPPVG